MDALKTLPERLSRVEGRVQEHSKSVEEIGNRFTLMEGRFDRMESRFDRLEASTNARFQALEANVNARFERVESRLDHLDRKIEGVDAKLGEAVDQIKGATAEYFRWTAGLIITTGITLGAGLIHFGR